MGKFFLVILIALTFASCYQDASVNEIKNSFNQFLNSLEIDDIHQSKKFAPFLVDMDEENLAAVFKQFRILGDIDYDIEILKTSNDTYDLQISTNDTASLWNGISIAYHQDNDGLWVMGQIIKSSKQYIDIIPAKK